MQTPQKTTYPELQAQIQHFFHDKCRQDGQTVWRHVCGTAVHIHPVAFSIHNTPIHQACGSLGRIETHMIPYCPVCEPKPGGGCLHDLDAHNAPLVYAGPAMGTPILVWEFEEAPEEYKKLSPHGGDEDWLALFPPSFAKTGLPDWAEPPGFGAKETSVHQLRAGFFIAIGAHA